MSTIKTKVNEKSVTDFLNSVQNDQRREDSFKLLEIFKRATGLEPKMWGDSMIGYGQYHYKSDRSKQEGDWPLTGFSPRKNALTIYIMPGLDPYVDSLEDLGKFTRSVSCLYLKKLEDVDQEKLVELIKRSVKNMKVMYR